MREIKFRAWYEKEKEMQNVRDIYFNKETGEIESFITRGKKSTYATDVHTHKLMQYTGLKDKNGVEIYEGDIVDVCWSDVIGETRWAKIKIKNPFDYSVSEAVFLIHADELEIIGNIYENPELLETKKSS